MLLILFPCFFVLGTLSTEILKNKQSPNLISKSMLSLKEKNQDAVLDIKVKVLQNETKFLISRLGVEKL